MSIPYFSLFSSLSLETYSRVWVLAVHQPRRGLEELLNGMRYRSQLIFLNPDRNDIVQLPLGNIFARDLSMRASCVVDTKSVEKALELFDRLLRIGTNFERIKSTKLGRKSRIVQSLTLLSFSCTMETRWIKQGKRARELSSRRKGKTDFGRFADSSFDSLAFNVTLWFSLYIVGNLFSRPSFLGPSEETELWLRAKASSSLDSSHPSLSSLANSSDCLV